MNFPVRRGLLIGGNEEFSGTEHEVRNPATGEVVGTYQLASEIEVDRAVAAAESAQKAWSEANPGERSAILLKTSELIDRDAELIGEVMTREQGKPLPDAIKEVRYAAKVFDYYSKKISLLQDEERQTISPLHGSYVRRAPLGVVAGIVPWNYPVDLWAWKVAPALAAGNAIVVKPPVESPLAAGMTARLLYEAGLPSGLLSDLPGAIEVGVALTQHQRVRGISATCSTAAGVAIQMGAAKTMKRLTLELGGNCPFIVLDDADVELAAAAAARRSFSNAGQICIAVNRIIVSTRVADEFVERVAAIADAMIVGNGLTEGVEMGPTTTLGVKQKTGEHIAEALQRGAQKVTSRNSVLDSDRSQSHFAVPTVLDRVDPRSRIAREETFGPAVAVLRVDSTDEAIAIANDSDYGLAAYLYSSDLTRAHELARQLQFGGVGLNVNDVTELDAPFGGWKMSGFGRDLGPEALWGMTEPQHIRYLR